MDLSNFDPLFLKEELPSFIDNICSEWCKDGNKLFIVDLFKDI